MNSLAFSVDMNPGTHVLRQTSDSDRLANNGSLLYVLGSTKFTLEPL